MAKQRRARQTQVCAWIAMVAFSVAINYCAWEAFATPPAQNESSHHHETSDHHPEGEHPTESHDEVAGCCETLQAIITSKLDTTAGVVVTQPLDHPRFNVRPLVSLLESSCSTSGRPYPAREPPQERPFYRTTFASHAPPAFLA